MFRNGVNRGSSWGLFLLTLLSNGCISIPNLNPVHYARQILQVDANPPLRESEIKLEEESLNLLAQKDQPQPLYVEQNNHLLAQKDQLQPLHVRAQKSP